MISSVIWLLLIKMRIINPVSAPWDVYIPALIFEVILDCIFLPRILDKIDRWRKRK